MTKPQKPSGHTAGTEPKAGADLERALILRDVMDHAVSAQREVTAPRSLGSRRGRIILAACLCVPAVALSAYSWIAKPAFIWGPAPRAVPPAEADAMSRFALYMFAQRLEMYRLDEGFYPSSLDALDEDTPGIRYELVGDTAFVLTMQREGKVLTLASTDDFEAFLGQSISIMRGRQR